MADLPTIEDMEEGLAVAEEYEHPEPDAPVDGCSNLGHQQDLDVEDDEDIRGLA